MADGLQQRFGKLVAAHRRRKQWTQHDLAGFAKLSDDMVSRIESGTTGVRFATIVKLAGAFDVDPAELFTNELPTAIAQRPQLSAITRRLVDLSDGQLVWLAGIVEAALKKQV